MREMRKLILDIDGIYLKVLKLVKIGTTIQNACVSAGISTRYFYDNITKEQKNELRFYKTTTRISSSCGRGTRIFMTLETDDEDNV